MKRYEICGCVYNKEFVDVIDASNYYEAFKKLMKSFEVVDADEIDIIDVKENIYVEATDESTCCNSWRE